MSPFSVRAFRNAMAGALLLFAAGCGGGGGSGGPSSTDVTLTVPITDELQSAINAGNPVIIQASVDGGAPVGLTINPPEATATLSIADGSTHSIQITCYAANLFMTVPVAQATVSGFDPAVDGATLNVSATALAYLDTDSDGYTNLVEMTLGTDPDVATSHPTQPGTFSDTTGTVRLVGTAGVMPGVLTSAGAYGTVGFGTVTGGAATIHHH